MLVQFAIEAGGENGDVGMFAGEAGDAFGGGDEAQEPNPCRADALE